MMDNSITFKNVYPSDDFFYKKLVDPLVQTWTKGVQIIYPVTPKPIVLSSIINNKFHFSISEEYVEFIALDFRNKRISTISTDPRATTNYFEAKENNLPFETSIAFFKAEVLQKYKNNPEKYKIKDNRVMCRNIWVLEYAINEAGQVHVYMIRLRGIPYKEQLYWKSFNEPPEAGISERTYKTDFLGEWLDEKEATALEKMRYILDQWARSDSKWWRLRDTTLLDSVTVPYDENYKEWHEEFAKISKYVIESLNEKHIKKILDANDTNYGDNWKSLQLIEALLQNKNLLKENEKLIGLREARYIRNKAHSHLEGRDATRIKNQALRNHGSYAGHFEHVCRQIVDELKLIQKVFTQDCSSEQ